MKMSEIIKSLEITIKLDDINKIKSNLENIVYSLKNQKFFEFFSK